MIAPFIEGQRQRLANDEITRAGECPWTGGYCFGTESGKVLFYGPHGQVPSLESCETVAEEAINGVAFFQEFLGVTTRSEINLYRRGPQRTLETVGAGPGGAHGNVATPGGQFVAPMGTEGLFCFDVSPSRAWIDHAKDQKHNYYSLRYLASCESQETLACAARDDGLLTIRLDKNESVTPIVGLTAPGIDFIDVCSLHVPAWPYAVAALCLDRSVIFVRNMLTFEIPQTVRFDRFRGIPYSISSAQGHLLVLTSEEIVILPGLGSRFASGEPLDRPIHYRHKAIHAVDAFVSQDRELLILTDDGVNAFEISKLVNGRPEAVGLVESPDAPIWDEHYEAPELLTPPWSGLVATHA
jgi:hypothetical protein